ncbi:hypothetical protein BC835DRAFT_1415147 [Cytidiella melzeri]|nr:hypothetical protein BC835DRAFT_1415147 [Cytidiella melzeri]
MSKRPRDTHDTPESSISPPTRRLKLAQPASSPIRPSHSKLLTTPYSSCAIRTPYSVPSDSPSNPFGLKRSLLALDLPRITSFGKHSPLRLQLVTDSDTRGPTAQRRGRGGVYRVVQVPNNYTFRHLHKLILYLFASDIHLYHGSKTQPNSVRFRQSTTSKAAGKARADATSSSWGGHYFEVQKHISLFPETKRPGVIKPDGKTWAKLSSVRDRKLFRDLSDSCGDLDTSLPEMLEDGDTDKEEWTWEAEDDFTVAHVWPKGPLLDRGIIYHHSPSVRIHITVNTLPIPGRRGSGNTPFVFLAQGTTGSLFQIAHTIPDAEGNESYSVLNEEHESFPLPLSRDVIDRWNRPDVFQKFLRREADRERALRLPRSYDFEDDDQRSSEPPMAPPSDGLDVAYLSSSDDNDALSIYSTQSDSFVYPSNLSAVTPFPANPFRRRRLDLLGKRMAKLTRSGLRDVMSSDEEEKAKRAKKGKKAHGRGRPVSVAGKVVEKMKGRSTKELAPIRRLDSKGRDASHADWDPFGDEAELV